MKLKKTGLILQVRTGSTRLPNKIFKLLNGYPIIEYISERVKQIKADCELIIATTDKKQDDPIEYFAKKNNISYFRGSEDNVLERYYLTAKKFNINNIIRLTGDNPFLEADFVDLLLNFHILGNYDFSTNKGEYGSNAPIGTGMSIISFSALEKSYKNAITKYEKEHVIPYILDNKNKFNFGIHKIETLKQDFSNIALTIDTQEDFDKMENIAKQLNITPENYVSVYKIISNLKI